MSDKKTLPVVQTLNSDPKKGFKVPLLVIESAANIIAFAHIRVQGKPDAVALAMEICDAFMLETEVWGDQTDGNFRIYCRAFDGAYGVLEWKGSEGAKFTELFGLSEAAPYGYSEEQESDIPAFMNGMPVELD
jgi:hypothetical protein